MTVAASLFAVQTEMKALKEREDALKDELLGIMKANGIKTVKTEGDVYFMRAERQNLKVKIAYLAGAEKWADQNNAWKIDTGAILKLLRRSLKKPPKYFDISTSEYLVVKRPGATEDDD